MSKIKGIAFTGPIGSGKTTSAQAILDFARVEGIRAERISFAGPLKELAVKLIGRTIDKATDRKFLQALGMGMRADVLRDLGFDSLSQYLLKHHPVHLHCPGAVRLDPIELAQFRGVLADYVSDAKNTGHWGTPSHWVEKLSQTIRAMEADGVQLVVNDDMRFMNEYRLCEHFDFRSLRLTISPEERQRRIVARDGRFDPNMDNDVSETEWPHIHFHAQFNTDNPDAQINIVEYASTYFNTQGAAQAT